MKAMICTGIMLSLFTFADLSHANLTFCNSRSDGAWVAFVPTIYRISPQPCAVQELKGELVSWYYVAPNGGCTTLINGNIFNPTNGPGGNGGFDWYAEGANGEYWGDGSGGQYCPMTSEASYLDPQPLCNAGYVNFAYLRTDSYQDYTLTLQ